MTGISNRVDRLEDLIGNKDLDTSRLIENIRAVAEGFECPHIMTTGMHKILADQLRELSLMEELTEKVEAKSSTRTIPSRSVAIER